MDSLIFELQIVFYFQLFLSANVRHKNGKNATQNNKFAGASHYFVNLFAFTTWLWCEND